MRALFWLGILKKPLFWGVLLAWTWPLILLFFGEVVFAGPYVRLSTSWITSDYTVTSYNGRDLSDHTFGHAELGYRYWVNPHVRLEAFAAHRSSIETNSDYGLNWTGIAIDVEYK